MLPIYGRTRDESCIIQLFAKFDCSSPSVVIFIHANSAVELFRFLLHVKNGVEQVGFELGSTFCSSSSGSAVPRLHVLESLRPVPAFLGTS